MPSSTCERIDAPTCHCRVLVLAGYAPSLLNFRGPLLRALVNAGYEVVACAPGNDSVIEAKLRELGVSYEPLTLDRTGMNPLKDLLAFVLLCLLIRRHRPQLVLSYTIKPVIYGSLAALLMGVPRIFSMITGLGYTFTKPSLVNLIVRRLYKWSLKWNRVVFFQNRDDEAEFRRLKILPFRQPVQSTPVRAKPSDERSCANIGPKTVVLSGSGVDLEHFTFHPLPTYAPPTDAPTYHPTQAASAQAVTFLLIARLLRFKGTIEYAAAAGDLKQRYPSCRFQLLGPYDSSPAALRPDELKLWTDAGAIEYLGESEDVRPFLSDCDVYVLPSYSEGTPRSVLEAMATGRAIITTNGPGCRETVIGAAAAGAQVARAPVAEGPASIPTSNLNSQPESPRDAAIVDLPPGVSVGRNGFLIPVRDKTSLAWAMEQFILHPELRTRMGLASREYAEQRYDVHKVNAVILREIENHLKV